MKKTLLSIALLAAGAAAYAQISQGTIMLGGDLGFQSNGTTTKLSASSGTAPTNPPDGSSSNINLGIQGGYFVTDGLAVGLTIGFGSQTQGQAFTYTSGGTTNTLKWDNKSSTFTIGVFGRKYMEITEKFYFYGGLGFSYATGTTSSSNADISTNPPTVKSNPDGKVSGWDIAIAPGLAYFPSENWGIHFGLNNIIGYSSTTLKQDQLPVGNVTNSSEITKSQLNLGVGLTPTLGVAYFFTK